MQQESDRQLARKGDWRVARRRAGVLAALIVVVTLVWVLFGIQAAAIGQVALAVLGLLTLAIGAAWTLLAVPWRRNGLSPG
jgi:hypothetical protein